MNKEFDKLSDWCKANKSSVNPRKIQCNNNFSQTLRLIALKYDNEPILLTNKVRYFGATLHSKLDFHAHMKLIENKISR